MPTCMTQAAITQPLRHRPPSSAIGAASSIATDAAAIGGSTHAWSTTGRANGDGVPPSRSSRAAE